MRKTTTLCAALAVSVLAAGCANDGSGYRSDVYSAGMVNQAQEVKTVTIIAVMPARVAVNNYREREESSTVGMVLGAIAGAAVGAAVGDSPDAVIAGTVAGGALGNIGGRGLSRRRADHLPLRRQDVQLRTGRTRVRIQDRYGDHGFAQSQ